MDSGNSGSMQSSSCGDEIEEYDSRGESNQFSMFLNNPPLSTPAAPAAAPRARSISHHLLNPPPQSSSLQQQMFDPLANYYMDSLQKSSSTSNQNSFLNLDMMWSKGATTARSDQNNNDLSSLMVPSSSSTTSSHQNQQAFLLSQGMMVGQTRENINVVGSVPTTHHSLSLDHHQQRGTSLTNDQQNLQNNNMGSRNPKKRSRASRRAPTTVLTTDTTNFRAMVQEFTGIPAPPFSSPFPRTRLDLFGSSRSISSSSSHMDPPQQPPYLLRPFAHKIQSPHNHHSFPPSSSSMVENLLASNNSATINYHNLPQHQQNHPPLIQQHNQIIGFQSISQTPTTKYQIGSHQQPSLEITPNVDSHIKRGSVFEDLSHVNNTNIGNVVHHRQNMVPTSSDRVNNNMCNSSSENQWGTRTTSTSINGGDHGGILGSLSGIEERNCTSDFGLVKGQECTVVATTTRGEGTVESWINCSSSD